LKIPTLDEPFALASEQQKAFRERGHVVVRGLATIAEVAAFRPSLVEAGQSRRYDHRPFEERDTYGRAFVQMLNLWRVDPVARKFVFARRFARVAAELLGVRAVRLYHDQALFKEPGGGHTPWHQDQVYWPLETPHTITLWMPLVPVTLEMGPMTFASGSHELGSVSDLVIGDASEADLSRLVEEKGLSCMSCGEMQPGDASFHSGWTLHSAPPNQTQKMREAMTIIYYADGARVGPLDHPARRFDRDAWLKGCEPGTVAAGPHNPVLYDELSSS
jgi:ectoine hydroxylase-related dioxygenase (phytanoyl-CoA dioxygenase family)